MLKSFLAIISFLFVLQVNAQEVLKENQTKQVSTFYDFNKTKIMARGKYYVDELGETTDEHGKWTYYDRYGEVEEVRNYYKGRLNGEVSLYYPNGKLKQQGFFKFEAQDSIYQEWYENGKLKMKGQYKLDEPVGQWEYFYMDGRLKSVEEVKGEDNYIWQFYLPDSAHRHILVDGTGELVTFFTTGRVKEWYNYKNGLKHGAFEEYSVYDHLTVRGFYKEGIKDSAWLFNYVTGDKEKTCYYVDGKLDGEYKYYYDNGQLNVDGRYKEGKKDSEWTWYTNKGTRDMQGSFEDDLQHGAWTYWRPTGELSYTAHFKEGKKHGEWTYFYVTGEIFKKGKFENDFRNGEWNTWYEDGTLLMTGKYVNDKEQGEWLNYWDNGKLKNKATFTKGELDGKWVSHFPTGQLKLSGEYKQNLKVGEWTEYFSNGKPKDITNFKLFKKKSKMDYTPIYKDHVVMESRKNGAFKSYSDKDYKITEEGSYKDDKKDGEWIAYYPGGKVPAVVSTYKEGELHGKMKQYSRRGKLLQEMSYKDGLKHGKTVIYDKRGKVFKEVNYEFGQQVVEGGSGTFSPGK